MAAGAQDGRFDDLLERAVRRSRLSMRTRLGRLRSKAWHVGQAAVAAGAAWLIATELFHHTLPVFAPIAAVISLGMSYGQRLRRVAEITVGIAIGLVVADVFLHFFGSGAWQIALIVAVAMSAALLLDAGQLLVTQAAVQSIFVVAFVATPAASFDRWVDALIGGGVALVAATVVPAAPLRRPRVQAGEVVRTIASLLRESAQCVRDGDVERAARVLAEARTTDSLIRELQQAAAEGLDVIASSPLQRRHAPTVRRVADLVEPLDRALRSTRVLVRRVAVTANEHADVPDSYAAVLDELADATDVVARLLIDNAAPGSAQGGLVRAAALTGELAHTSIHADVLLVQIRSLVVDLLQVTAMSYDEAVAALPRLRDGS